MCPHLALRMATGQGGVFCSVETLSGCGQLPEQRRVANLRIDPTGDQPVEVHYSAEHVSTSTLRSLLTRGADLAIVGIVEIADSIRVEPLVIGTPWPEPEHPETLPSLESFLEESARAPLEDIDQFAKVSGQPLPADCNPIQPISERAFKECLASLLGDRSSKDWGGERSDHFTSHLSINGRSFIAAFLLKGPARFAPMTTRHLGKNQDQLLRLIEEPAEILVLRHCHEVTAPVRKLLRMLATAPPHSRRYHVTGR